MLCAILAVAVSILADKYNKTSLGILKRQVFFKKMPCPQKFQKHEVFDIFGLDFLDEGQKFQVLFI